MLLLLKKEGEFLVIAADVGGLEGDSDCGVGVAIDLAIHAEGKLLQEVIQISHVLRIGYIVEQPSILRPLSRTHQACLEEASLLRSN